jgi:hypothetical protein
VVPVMVRVLGGEGGRQRGSSHAPTFRAALLQWQKRFFGVKMRDLDRHVHVVKT